jgi:GrxC family glutaredoxin
MVSRVVIYTKDYCPFCNYAKALLRSKEVVFQEIDVTSDDRQQEEMIRLSGRRTVPQIFIDDTPIGGFEELRQLENEGKLDRVLGRNS